MAKASIFSKDYKKIMRKRKRRLRIIYFLTLVIVVVISIKLVDYDFSNVKNKLQLWVKDDKDKEAVIDDESTDTKKTIDNEIVENKDTVIEENEEETEKVVEEVSEEKINIVINKVNLALVLKKLDENNKTIIGIENKPDNYYYSVSSNGKSALIIDNMQNLQLVKNTGEVINLTLNKYTAPNGEIFEKDNVLATYSGYIWHSNARILSDNKIVYISNVPYFGYGLDQYITIIDLKNKAHSTIWNMKGKSIKFEEFINNRLKVTIDGNIRYINENGEETS